MSKETSIMDDMLNIKRLLNEFDSLSAPTVLKRVPNPAMTGFRVGASATYPERDTDENA